MRLYEFEAKRLLAAAGVATPAGRVVGSPEEARAAASELGAPVVVKLQAQSGKRGKRGLIRFADTPEEAAEAIRQIAGLVEPTARAEMRALVEERLSISAELYAALAVEPGHYRASLLLSRRGGMDIEEVVTAEPEALSMVWIDPRLGLRRYQAVDAARRAGLESDLLVPCADVCLRLYDLFRARDAELVEVNPLALTEDRRLVAADAKVVIDDGALPRQAEMQAIARSRPEAAGFEAIMAERGVHYIELGGEVAVITPGAGLNMALIDWLAERGLSAKCFMDITGAGVADWSALFSGQFPRTFAETILLALRHLAGQGVRLFLINVTSGGSPVDGRIRGIHHAIQALERPDCRFVLHAAGNNQEAARAFLREVGFPVPGSLSEAVDLLVGVASR